MKVKYILEAKMKRTLLSAMLAILCVTAYAQQAVVIIPPFDLVGGTTAGERDTITRIFMGDLATKRVFRVADRGSVEKRIAETKWQMSDYADNEKTAELNKGLNADYLIIGTIAKLGTATVMDAMLEDLNTFEVVGNSRIRFTKPEEVYDLMEGFVATLVQNAIGSGNSGGRPATPIGRPGAVPDGFVPIEGGTFLMGSPASEAERRDWEGPQHQVTVSGFYMGEYEVTQAEYQAVMGTNPSWFKGDNLPVEMVSWYDAVRYCNQRSTNERLTPAYNISGSTENPFVTWNKNANGYRLPTEAEWEYACRAGTTTPFSTGYNITTSQANYNGNFPYNGNSKGIYREKTTAVGSFAPNGYGLYDMHGNVQEWCWDWLGDHSGSAQTDPAGAASGSSRMTRGASWTSFADYLRSAKPGGFTPSTRGAHLGFRVVRNAQ